MEDDVKISRIKTIKIIYYLMAVDGVICQSEEEKFDEIAREIDLNFIHYKEEIMAECQAQIEKVVDKEKYYEAVQECVGRVIHGSASMTSDFNFPVYPVVGRTLDFKQVSGRVLVWNLLAIAFSDGKYSKEERKLIQYVISALNIDTTFFFEAENTMKAIAALEKEEKWLRTTKKPYSVIETQINELEHRRAIIENSVKKLIAM